MADQLKHEIDLIDCYRLAVNFGKPAVDKAIAVINESLLESKSSSSIDEIAAPPDQAI